MPWRRRLLMTWPRPGPTSACCATVTVQDCWTRALLICPTFSWSIALLQTAMAMAASGTFPMAITGYLEQARAAAQRTFIPGTETAGTGQDDVSATVFLAWAKSDQAGRCLDAALAMLAVLASQALLSHRSRRPATAISSFLDEVRAIIPPVEADRVLGPELARLASQFTRHVFSAEIA